MADFGPQIAEDVVTACTAGAAEVGEAFSRTLDQTLKLDVGTAGTLDLANLPEGFDGPALVIVLTVDDVAAVAVLPESCGLLPDWIAAPDPTGVSKLATLAQELGMLLLPETLMASDFQAIRVDNAREALSSGQPADDAATVSMTLSAEADASGTLTLAWPLSDPKALLSSGASEDAAADTPSKSNEPAAVPQQSAAQPVAEPMAAASDGEGVESLPSYARSLLRIKLPVTVTLASKKQPVEQITSLNPGSIIQFEKSCEEMLELGVGDQKIGLGEAVKVGDKFGLRVTSLVLPDERFYSIRVARQ